MAEAWPTEFIAKTVDFRLQKNTRRFESPVTRSTQILDLQGKRWVANFMFRVVGRAKGQKFQALLDRGETFSMWDMTRDYPISGTLSGILTNGAWVRGNTIINIDGLPASQTWLKAGDLIGIGGKLYGLENDAVANVAGLASITLNRGLLANVANDAAVTLSRPTCEMALVDDDQNSSVIDYQKVYDFSLSFIEIF